MTTLRALECLVALVDHGSVGAAAAALHMSQPALSHQVAGLERELGAAVAERLWRGIRITAAGRAAADEARVALRAAEQAVEIGRRVGRTDAGKLRIACSETMTGWLLLPVLRQWRSQRPDVQLELSEFTNADVMLDLVEAGQIDVAVGPRPTRVGHVHIEVFGKQPAVVVSASGHPLADQTGVRVAALEGEPFIHYDHENALAAWVDQLAARNGIALKAILRTRSPRTAAQLAAAGIGVAIVPVSALSLRPAGTVRQFRPEITIEVVAIVAAPSDTLAQQFVADIHRSGLPSRARRTT